MKKTIASLLVLGALVLPASSAFASGREIGDCSPSDKRALEYERTTPDGEHNHICLNYP